jgi:hypothetical protein
MILKADIAASEFASLPINPDTSSAIALAYNLAATPDYWVWRTKVTKSELTNNTSQDGTVFTWNGNGYILRSQGERDAFRALFNGSDEVNPSLPQVRQAFLDIFSGTGNAALNREHLAAIGRRKATRAEKLFAAGAGTTVSPSLLDFEGNLSFQDVSQARELP